MKGLWMLDPDFGQHLRTGEVIVKSGLPVTDPFSYTMPDWKYIDHAWLSDVLVWVGYQAGGTEFLAAVYATMAIGALWLVTDKGRWGVVTAILGAAVLIGRAGVRQQVEDWLLIAVILRLLEDAVWQKWKWVVPVIFGWWVNLHSGVAMGLAILGAGVTGKILTNTLPPTSPSGPSPSISQARGFAAGEGSQAVKALFVGGLVVAAVLINPYGIRLWKEIGEVAGDRSLKTTIAEWLPWYGGVDLAFWMLAAMVGMWGWKYRRVMGWPERLIVGGTFVAGLSSLRHMPVFALTAGWGLGKVWKAFEEDVGVNDEARRRLGGFYKLMVGVAVMVFVVQGGLELWFSRSLSEASFYPQKAVAWLKGQPDMGRLFSTYDWGGYLIWKLPEYKTFVDGRMPSWKCSMFNVQCLMPGYSAFEEFLDITREGADFEPIFDKHGVEAVLWPKRDLVKTKVWINIELGKPGKKPKPLPVRLEAVGWKMVYEDGAALIFMRKGM
ncbi:MAG: hypothetical protein G01um101416_262 [Microgenomates group bacterium Gr01-1014_16]|nr:MAG: hypothetical protein G01um101416_262 [Microgenomates group bacterium Gr01-1014_16]